MAVVGIIPARYASSRFPGKPLTQIDGKSMLQRVYEQASKARLLSEVVIATDDPRIAEHAATFRAPVLMTGSQHPSGTDRCYEAYRLLGKNYDYVINIQGDEPFLDPDQVDSLAAACDGQIEIATQMIRCTSNEVLFDKGEVKIVLNSSNDAIYFSRSVIPALKGIPESEWHSSYRYFRHVGMYAYRVDVLAKITRLPVSPLEKAESLEQLRWLENGFKVRCVETTHDSHCIDTPEDIEKVLRLMNTGS
jgi:3-deoxy-manno-octulosonate cytidylyltransferase (CMP-KDO synthetase)